MATKQDLDASENKVLAAVATLGSDLKATLADFVAKQAAGQDVQPQVDKMNAIADQLTALDATVKAADPGPTSGSTPASTTAS